MLVTRCKVKQCKSAATHEAISLVDTKYDGIHRKSALVCKKHQQMFLQKHLKWSGVLERETVRATTEAAHASN
jgi:hypothetical protein